MAGKKSKKKSDKKPAQKSDKKSDKATLSLVSGSGESNLVALLDRVVPHDGKEEYSDLREDVISSRDSIDRGRWNMAKALYQIHDQVIWDNWGYLSWDEYVSCEVGMNVRTTQYLTAMYHCFYVELGKGLSHEEKEKIIERVSAIGWTKARVLVGVVTRENLDEWLERAKNMSSAELETVAKKALLEQKGKDSSKVESVKIVNLRLFEEQFELWLQAYEVGKGIAKSEKKGHVFSLICQDFVATTMAQKGLPHERRARYIDRNGAILGLKFIAVDKESGKVVHGEELLEELKKNSG